jgi:hypothetical protein
MIKILLKLKILKIKIKINYKKSNFYIFYTTFY